MSNRLTSRLLRHTIPVAMVSSSLLFAIACAKGGNNKGTRMDTVSQNNQKLNATIDRAFKESFPSNPLDVKAKTSIELAEKVEGLSAYMKTAEGQATADLEVRFLVKSESVVAAGFIDKKEKAAMKDLELKTPRDNRFTIQARCADARCEFVVVHLQEKEGSGSNEVTRRFAAVMKVLAEKAQKETLTLANAKTEADKRNVCVQELTVQNANGRSILGIGGTSSPKVTDKVSVETVEAKKRTLDCKVSNDGVTPAPGVQGLRPPTNPGQAPGTVTPAQQAPVTNAPQVPVTQAPQAPGFSAPASGSDTAPITSGGAAANPGTPAEPGQAGDPNPNTPPETNADGEQIIHGH